MPTPNSGFQWMTIDGVVGSTASGSISGGSGFNDVSVAITHSVGGMEAHVGMVGAEVFPAEYVVPSVGTQIKNINAGVFQATFSKPIINALVAFASVGQPGYPVPVQVSRPFTPIWGIDTTYQDPVNATQYNQFTGAEGYNIIRIDGELTEVTFTYTVSENYCTVCFGFVDQNDPELVRGNPFFDKYAYGDEDGCTRYRRLRLLGYL